MQALKYKQAKILCTHSYTCNEFVPNHDKLLSYFTTDESAFEAWVDLHSSCQYRLPRPDRRGGRFPRVFEQRNEVCATLTTPAVTHQPLVSGKSAAKRSARSATAQRLTSAEVPAAAADVRIRCLHISAGNTNSSTTGVISANRTKGVDYRRQSWKSCSSIHFAQPVKMLTQGHLKPGHHS